MFSSTNAATRNKVSHHGAADRPPLWRPSISARLALRRYLLSGALLGGGSQHFPPPLRPGGHLVDPDLISYSPIALGDQTGSEYSQNADRSGQDIRRPCGEIQELNTRLILPGYHKVVARMGHRPLEEHGAPARTDVFERELTANVVGHQ